VTLCVIAAGESALAALRTAPDMLVLLSPAAFSPDELAGLRAPGVPRLFLYGSRDAAADETASALRGAAIGWAGSIAFPTRDQGAALLGGEWAAQAVERIAAFVDEQTYIAAPR
jgi:hypothetical protein